jgi:hypothetical protein
VCNAQNFCMFGLYYLLVIRYGWKNEYLAIEPWMHFVAICSALITGVVRLALDLRVVSERLVSLSTRFHYSLGIERALPPPPLTFSEPSSVLNRHIAFKFPRRFYWCDSILQNGTNSWAIKVLIHPPCLLAGSVATMSTLQLVFRHSDQPLRPHPDKHFSALPDGSWRCLQMVHAKTQLKRGARKTHKT